MLVRQPYTPNQQPHIVLALLLGTTIFAELGNHCYFNYLVNLIDLDKVWHSNCCVAAYATLIRGMRNGVHKTNII